MCGARAELITAVGRTSSAPMQTCACEGGVVSDATRHGPRTRLRQRTAPAAPRRSRGFTTARARVDTMKSPRTWQLARTINYYDYLVCTCRYS